MIWVSSYDFLRRTEIVEIKMLLLSRNVNRNKLIIKFTMSFELFDANGRIVQMQCIRHIYNKFLYHVC